MTTYLPDVESHVTFIWVLIVLNFMLINLYRRPKNPVPHPILFLPTRGSQKVYRTFPHTRMCTRVHTHTHFLYIMSKYRHTYTMLFCFSRFLTLVYIGNLLELIFHTHHHMTRSYSSTLLSMPIIQSLGKTKNPTKSSFILVIGNKFEPWPPNWKTSTCSITLELPPLPSNVPFSWEQHIYSEGVLPRSPESQR